jgi:hypothetical protein
MLPQFPIDLIFALVTLRFEQEFNGTELFQDENWASCECYCLSTNARLSMTDKQETYARKRINQTLHIKFQVG